MVTIEILVVSLMLLAVYIGLLLCAVQSNIRDYKDEIIKEIRELKRKLDKIEEFNTY